MENFNNNSQNSLHNPSATIIPRMLPIKEVTYFTGLSCTTIYDMLDKKSERYDPTFPIQVKLTKEFKERDGFKARNGRVAWVASEIAQWLESKMAERVH